MWKSIDISKLDNLVANWESYRNKNNQTMKIKFSEYLEMFGDVDITDSVGIVTREDFEATFTKEFVEKNFEDLAHYWFEGLNAQVNFEMVLECLTEMNEFEKGIIKKEGN